MLPSIIHSFPLHCGRSSQTHATTSQSGATTGGISIIDVHEQFLRSDPQPSARVRHSECYCPFRNQPLCSFTSCGFRPFMFSLTVYFLPFNLSSLTSFFLLTHFCFMSSPTAFLVKPTITVCSEIKRHFKGIQTLQPLQLCQLLDRKTKVNVGDVCR